MKIGYKYPMEPAKEIFLRAARQAVETERLNEVQKSADGDCQLT